MNLRRPGRDGLAGLRDKYVDKARGLRILSVHLAQFGWQVWPLSMKDAAMTALPKPSDDGPIVLLNASYEPLSMNVTLKRAARLLVKGKAVVLEAAQGRFLRNWPWPRVLILVKYVRIGHDVLYRQPSVSRTGVLKRDAHCCAYCGKHATTIDHLVPKSRGGAMAWLNLVAACTRCNSHKKNRTPDEAGMPLRFKPFVPSRLALGDRGLPFAVPA